MSKAGELKAGMKEPKIGDKVRATMNGDIWFTGTYAEESDVFAQYGVEVDDFGGELRYFIRAELIKPERRSHE